MTTLSWQGARWAMAEVEPERVEAMATGLGLSAVAARCLALRWPGPGLPGQDWLQPSLQVLHDPAQMLNMDRALPRLHQAVDRRERVRIITDYDVDGTTSSLILQAVLRLLAPDLPLDYHIPTRFDEGYGFSVAAAERAVADGVGLIVTADIGVRDHAAVQTAVAGGVDVLICDHHLAAGDEVPAQAIVLCPPQRGCTYPNPSLAACGVSLKLAQGLLAGHPKRDPILRSLLKLAAIGTVADMVPLTTAENRAIVTLGLRELNTGRHNAGLDALLQVCRFRGPISETDLGFRVGPRINAAGRLQDARIVVELLTSRDPELSARLAAELDRMNAERRGIQDRLVTEALGRIAPGDPPAFVVVAGDEREGWHRGVVGVVASKLKDKVRRPVAVVSIQGDLAVGSVRSVAGVHAVQALDAVADLLEKYGGHPMAAGFTVPTRALDALTERLVAWAAERSEGQPEAWISRVDAEVRPEQLTESLVRELATLGPFGMGNPRPRLLVRGVQLSGPRVVAGGKLLKLQLARPQGRMTANWWHAADQAEALTRGPVDLIGELGVSTWRGPPEPELQIEDARDAV